MTTCNCGDDNRPGYLHIAGTRPSPEGDPTAFDRYLEAVRATRREHPEQRPGQAAYNTLDVLHPELADQIHGTDRDPFYIDARLPAFLLFCREHLHVEGS